MFNIFKKKDKYEDFELTRSIPVTTPWTLISTSSEDKEITVKTRKRKSGKYSRTVSVEVCRHSRRSGVTSIQSHSFTPRSLCTLGCNDE